MAAIVSGKPSDILVVRQIRIRIDQIQVIVVVQGNPAIRLKVSAGVFVAVDPLIHLVSV